MWLWLLQTIGMAQAALVLGISVVVFARYLRDPRAGHIALIALSYLLLTIQVGLRLAFEPQTVGSWQLWNGLIAFALGDYALLRILTWSRHKGTNNWRR